MGEKIGQKPLGEMGKWVKWVNYQRENDPKTVIRSRWLKRIKCQLNGPNTIGGKGYMTQAGELLMGIWVKDLWKWVGDLRGYITY